MTTTTMLLLLVVVRMMLVIGVMIMMTQRQPSKMNTVQWYMNKLLILKIWNIRHRLTSVLILPNWYTF